MQINKIKSNHSFGMDLIAKEPFWTIIQYKVWEYPNEKDSKELKAAVTKICKNEKIKDSYEIKKTEKITKKFCKNKFNLESKYFDYIKTTYKLVNSKNKVVFIKKFGEFDTTLVEQKHSDDKFVKYIARNLKRIQLFEKLEKLKSWRIKL